ncbi:hypothetical protein J1N35_010807, partial [Gossypium stocksii]
GKNDWEKKANAKRSDNGEVVDDEALESDDVTSHVEAIKDVLTPQRVEYVHPRITYQENYS